jgi:rsbT co-antagonist protein RsbR
MTVPPRAADDPRLRRIHDIVDRVGDGQGDGQEETAGAPSGEDDWLGDLLAAVEVLAAEVEAARAAAYQRGRRLEDLMDVCLALVAFDYTKKASISDDNDVFDGMATALNMLGEELDASTVSVAYVDDVFESMSDALVIVGMDQHIKRVNKATCTLAGLPRDELVGKPLDAIVPEVSVSDLVARGGVHDEERGMRTADGRVIQVSFSASLLRHEKGGAKEIVCVARDLTASKQAEAEQWRLRETMQRQAILVEELSTPLIPITKEIVVVPLVGSLDEGRAERLTTALLTGVAERGARTAILDITGIRAVDSAAVERIIRAVHAMRFLGAKVVLTGVRADVAKALVLVDADLGVPTFSALQHGIAQALRWSRDSAR